MDDRIPRPAPHFLLVAGTASLALALAGCGSDPKGTADDEPPRTPDDDPSLDGPRGEAPTGTPPGPIGPRPALVLGDSVAGAVATIEPSEAGSGGAELVHVGDVDADGFDDLALLDAGEPSSGPDVASPPGSLRVLYGGPERPVARDPVAELDPGASFAILAPADDRFVSVAPVGDVNADGFDDVALSSASGERLRIVHGGPRRAGALDPDGAGASAGFSIVQRGGFRYPAIASAGDWNGDGVGDVVVAHRYARPDSGDGRPVGASLVFGIAGFRTDVDLDALGTGAGVRFVSANPDDRLGAAAAPIGDFDGDGIDDLALSAPGRGFSYAPPHDAGRAFVVYGRADAPRSPVDVDALSAADALVLEQPGGGPWLGGSLSASDVDGDGLPELLVGARAAPEQLGEVNYLLRGAPFRRDSPVPIEAAAREAGTLLTSDGTFGDVDARFAGDANGDGVADLVVRGSTRQSVASYVKYHYLALAFVPPGGFGPEIDVDERIELAGQRVLLAGDDPAGPDDDVPRSLGVSGRGDVDGDGIDDAAIGGDRPDPGTPPRAWLVYGAR